MGHLKTLTTELAGLEPALLAAPADGALVCNSTKFSDPVAGRITQLQHNIAVEWLYSRIEWYQAELAALQAGDTSKSGGLLAGAANVRTRTKVVNGVGYVFAYNYTNLVQPVTFTWQSAPTSVRESRSGQTYALTGAAWSDTFGPYESRIYIIDGGAAPPPPPQNLTVSFTSPASGATVRGMLTVTMAATGGSGYTYRLAVDGTTVYTGTNPSVGWDTTTFTNAQHTLTANVTDASNNTGSASMPVTVSNVPPPPPPASFTASFSYPATGATVSGSQSVGMATTADWGTTKTFTLSIDGTVITSQTVATGTTLWYTWDTTTASNGAHTLQLAVTMNGQTATATLSVTVSNGAPPPPPPTSFTASFSYPASGATVSGNQGVGMATTAAWGQAKTFTLSVDGTVLTSQTLTGTTLWYTWDTTKAKPGSRTLKLVVTMNGQTATVTLSVKVKR
jgi:hypothetical protein